MFPGEVGKKLPVKVTVGYAGFAQSFSHLTILRPVVTFVGEVISKIANSSK